MHLGMIGLGRMGGNMVRRRVICIVDRMVPAISSKWSITASNTE
jgi:6-phosphogluconate dehydrogenase (decarboxylating)